MQTLDLVRNLRAAFPRQSFQTETEAVYTAALADLDPELLTVVVREAIITYEHLPTVAELREDYHSRQPRESIEEDDIDWQKRYEKMDPQERAAAEARLQRLGIRR
jgi:hypothetical protein